MKFCDKFEFKFIIIEGGHIIWESGDVNRTFDFNEAKDIKNFSCGDYTLVHDKCNNSQTLKLKCEWRI
jgi:hypothetical protein